MTKSIFDGKDIVYEPRHPEPGEYERRRADTMQEYLYHALKALGRPIVVPIDDYKGVQLGIAPPSEIFHKRLPSGDIEVYVGSRE